MISTVKTFAFALRTAGTFVCVFFTMFFVYRLFSRLEPPAQVDIKSYGEAPGITLPQK